MTAQILYITNTQQSLSPTAVTRSVKVKRLCIAIIVALYASIVSHFPVLAAESSSRLQDKTLRISNAHLYADVVLHGAILSALGWIEHGHTADWLLPKSNYGDTAVRYGLFLCFDRWGPVSSAEELQGIPFHGAAGLIPWTPLLITSQAITLSTQLPVTKLEATRTFRFAETADTFLIENIFYNPNHAKSDYNSVEHILVGHRWLTANIRLFSNATHGFIQTDNHIDTDSHLEWPYVIINERTWNLSHLHVPEGSNIFTMAFPLQDKLGWICMLDRSTGDMIGYVWHLNEYPWLNLWWYCQNKELQYFSIEPGTTGVSRPLPELEKMKTKLGRPVFATLPAKGTSRTYRLWCFAIRKMDPNAVVDKVTINPQNTAILVHAGNQQISLALP